MPDVLNEYYVFLSPIAWGVGGCQNWSPHSVFLIWFGIKAMVTSWVWLHSLEWNEPSSLGYPSGEISAVKGLNILDASWIICKLYSPMWYVKTCQISSKKCQLWYSPKKEERKKDINNNIKNMILTIQWSDSYSLNARETRICSSLMSRSQPW
jgi:hypothetical protein